MAFLMICAAILVVIGAFALHVGLGLIVLGVGAFIFFNDIR